MSTIFQKYISKATYAIISAILFFGLSFDSVSMQYVQRRVHVAILGGGMSGLTAAYNLHKGGVPVEIFEGRDRLGGRTHTHYYNPEKTQFYEEGGTKIDSDHKDSIALAKDLKVELVRSGYGHGKFSVFSHQHLIPPIDVVHALGELSGFLSNLNGTYLSGTLVSTKQGSHYVTQPMIPHIASSNLSPLCQGLLKTIYDAETGVSLNQASMYHIGWISEDIKEYEDLISIRNKLGPFLSKGISLKYYTLTVKQGVSHFVQRLSQVHKPDSIHLNHKLTHVGKEGDHYVLTFANGSVVEADRVIMTLPFSTLRDVTIDSSLSLPDLTKEAIHTLPYGTNAKIGMTADGNKEFQDEMLYYLNVGESVVAWPGTRALTIFLAAETGRDLTVESAVKIVAQNLPNIQHEYPGFHFGNMVIKNWHQDEFAKGSYSAHVEGMNFDLLSQATHYKGMARFAEPIDNNRFIFAGEHTRLDGSEGHIEGAVRSGIVAAKILFEGMGKHH
ncbi:MAG: FAD-dependent oxidoreductase [Alphaproteobacteria bacterium]|nr:FAD-dependent oxidoreductase [Alphaproteobacteria bacterium]